MESSKVMKEAAFILLIILVSAGVLFALSAVLKPSLKKTCPNGASVNAGEKCPCSFACCPADSNFSRKDCNAGFKCEKNKCVKQQIIQEKEDCPFECCLEDSEFKPKQCSTGLSCENSNCIKPDCPFECCLEGQYRQKECSADENCTNNSCVATPILKLACPFSCCTTLDVNYSLKPCQSGFDCNSHNCVIHKTNCPFECCTATDTNYLQKACSSSAYYCSSHRCLSYGGNNPPGGITKIDCPYACCESTDTLYFEKACPAGQNCSEHLCTSTQPLQPQEGTNCGYSTLECTVPAAWFCVKSTSKVYFSDENYTLNIPNSNLTGDYCTYYVRLDYSTTRPSRVGQDMNCVIPKTSRSLSEEFVKSIVTGQFPQFCTGPLTSS